MITRPTLLLNKDKCLKNIERMASKAKNSNVVFRPHFKTHQSAEVGHWFKDFGVECITVSSVKMAEYFANNGWSDITIAFPANILEWKAIDHLASKINLNLVVECHETIQYFEKNLTHPVGLYVKADTGYGRTGIAAEDYDKIQTVLKLLKSCKKLIFIGFLSHAGHTYNSHNQDEIRQIARNTTEQLLALKTFMSNDFPLIQLSYGDTPSCSILDDFSDFDEIRPGCFTFYDEMQHSLGACSKDDIAIALAAPVVAKQIEKKQVIIHGGAVHLSKDTICNKKGENYFGTAVRLNGYNWDQQQVLGRVTKLSQEHGTILVNDNALTSLHIGDVIAILPIHACLTSNLMKEYRCSDGKIISMMP